MFFIGLALEGDAENPVGVVVDQGVLLGVLLLARTIVHQRCLLLVARAALVVGLLVALYVDDGELDALGADHVCDLVVLLVERGALDEEPVYVLAHLRRVLQLVLQLVLDLLHQLDLVQRLDLLLVREHGDGEHVQELLRVEERGDVLGLDLAEVGQRVAHEVDARGEVLGPVEQVFVGLVLAPALGDEVVHERLLHVVDVEVGVALLARDYVGDVGFD